MLGQSWGGILGYEYLRTGGGKGVMDSEGCLSFVISNTPTSVAQVEADAGRLMSKLVEEMGQEKASEQFSKQHECRLPEKPKLLQDSFAHAGHLWRGTRCWLCSLLRTHDIVPIVCGEVVCNQHHAPRRDL